MFNRKKRNDPGLYGKFEHVDISKTKQVKDQEQKIPAPEVDEPEPEVQHIPGFKAEAFGVHDTDTSEHADYTDDDDLASLEQLIKRIKMKAKQGVHPEPRRSDLEELKQQDSPFEEGQEAEGASAGSLLTSSSFIQGLESDLLGDDTGSRTIQKQVEKTLERLLDDILRLSPSQRQQIITSDVFKSFLGLLAEEKDVTDE